MRDKPPSVYALPDPYEGITIPAEEHKATLKKLFDSLENLELPAIDTKAVNFNILRDAMDVSAAQLCDRPPLSVQEVISIACRQYARVYAIHQLGLYDADPHIGNKSEAVEHMQHGITFLQSALGEASTKVLVQYISYHVDSTIEGLFKVERKSGPGITG